MTKEELEKEAEVYADTVKCEWENDTYWVDCRDKVTDAYLASAEPREKRIEELKKENAELKKVKQVKIEVTRDYKKLAKDLQEQGDQLTKAKEIISEFVEWANWQGNSKCPSFKSIQDKAEQFLKDSEVEK